MDKGLEDWIDSSTRIHLMTLPLEVTEDNLRSLREKIVCQRCGECCKMKGGVKLREKDIDDISDFLKINAVNFLREYTSRVEGSNQLKSPCPFQKDNSCKVYKSRPLACRTYPVYIMKGRLGVRCCPAGKELIKSTLKEETNVET